MIMNIIQYFSHLEQNLRPLISAYGEWIYIALFCVVFLETGIFILAPLLPSDTLIFAASSLSSLHMLNIIWLLLLFTTAAVAGDSLNYLLGRKIGIRIFNLNFWILNKKNLEKTKDFYSRYGSKTVFFGRFIPVIRSIVPFTAGSGSMKYLRFISYSLPGCILWATLYSMAGFLFGNLPFAQENLTWILAGIGLIMALPGIVQFLWIQRAMKRNA